MTADERAQVAAFKKNEKAYWDAHVQFGSDPELRAKWFHGAGWDAALAHRSKELEAYREVLEQKQRIIAVMAHDLLLLGVNFDFDKALDRWKELNR